MHAESCHPTVASNLLPHRPTAPHQGSLRQLFQSGQAHARAAMSDAERYISEIPGSRRLRGVELKVPVIIGTYAYPLKKPEEFATHEWVVYVRGPNNEDISHVIPKVRRGAAPCVLVPSWRQ